MTGLVYAIAFLEGVITFLSPCLLPLLPVYITFFAGQGGGVRTALRNAAGFVLGFTAVFTLMGAFASGAGSILLKHSLAANLFMGAAMVLFGLNYLGVFRLGFLNREVRSGWQPRRVGFFSCTLFGALFSIGWTPCVGAFLGSALLLAASSAQKGAGVLMLLLYSAGLGVPFLFSAVLIGRLKSSLEFLKRHMRAIRVFSGWFLIAVGVLMACGVFSWFQRIL